MKIQLSKTAQSDIQSVLRYSLENFGHSTMKKYQSLIAQAIDDIAETPNRLGVKSVSGHNDYYQYHLKMSRRNVSGQQIANPSHCIIFRWQDNDTLAIIRLLHERMLIEQHIH